MPRKALVLLALTACTGEIVLPRPGVLGPIDVGRFGPDEPPPPELGPFDELLPQPDATAIPASTTAARARRILML